MVRLRQFGGGENDALFGRAQQAKSTDGKSWRARINAATGRNLPRKRIASSACLECILEAIRYLALSSVQPRRSTDFSRILPSATHGAHANTPTTHLCCSLCPRSVVAPAPVPALAPAAPSPALSRQRLGPTLIGSLTARLLQLPASGPPSIAVTFASPCRGGGGCTESRTPESELRHAELGCVAGPTPRPAWSDLGGVMVVRGGKHTERGGEQRSGSECRCRDERGW